MDSNPLLQQAFTLIINRYADGMIITVVAITLACIIFAAPEILTGGFKKIFHWFHDQPESNMRQIVASRDGKAHHFNFDMNTQGKEHDDVMNWLKSQGNIAFSPYVDNLDQHDNSITYLRSNDLVDPDDEIENEDEVDFTEFSTASLQKYFNENQAKNSHSTKDDDDLEPDPFDESLTTTRLNNSISYINDSSDRSFRMAEATRYSMFDDIKTDLDDDYFNQDGKQLMPSIFNDDGSIDYEDKSN